MDFEINDDKGHEVRSMPVETEAGSEFVKDGPTDAKSGCVKDGPLDVGRGVKGAPQATALGMMVAIVQAVSSQVAHAVGAAGRGFGVTAALDVAAMHELPVIPSLPLLVACRAVRDVDVAVPLGPLAAQEVVAVPPLRAHGSRKAGRGIGRTVALAPGAASVRGLDRALQAVRPPSRAGQAGAARGRALRRASFCKVRAGMLGMRASPTTRWAAPHCSQLAQAFHVGSAKGGAQVAGACRRRHGGRRLARAPNLRASTGRQVREPSGMTPRPTREAPRMPPGSLTGLL